MTEDEWIAFARTGNPHVMHVGALDAPLCGVVGSQTSAIQLRHDYACKLLDKHFITASELPMIEQCLLFGRVLCDRNHHLTFLHYDSVVFGRWYHLTIKSAAYGSELWVSTFHRTRWRHVEITTNRAALIRDVIA